MSEFWNTVLSAESFIPHGHCYLWKPSLVWLHLTADTLIALAYYSIPITLFYFVQKRKDLPFNWIFLLFCAFIMACGTTHLMEVWTLWHPTYWLAGVLKVGTAAISLVTAIELIPIMPQALALPSPAQLEETNQELQAQIAERLKIEEELKKYQSQLEQLVAERTFELQASNKRTEELLEREKQAKTEIKRQLAEIEAIYATAPIGLCVLDTEFRFIRINEFLAETNGLPISKHLGRTVREILPELGELQEPMFEQVIQTGEPILNIEVHGSTIAQSQAQRDWLVNYYPLRGTDDQILGINITALEITERKIIEQELEKRAAELTLVNTTLAQTMILLKERNQELNQFAYVVSHDLKAPLRGIYTLSEWLEEELTDEQLSKANRYKLELLRRRVYRMDALINGLLEYSRVGRTKIDVETVAVAELLAEISDSLAIPDTFTLQIEPGMPIIVTKRLLLSQVFSNLIDNGIKHHVRSDGCIQIAVQERGDFYEFSITDNGPGIEAKYHQKIFEIFQTLQPRDFKESTGIGLAIVKKIVEAEGGTIQVVSQVDHGTTFRFTWPKQIKPNITLF